MLKLACHCFVKNYCARLLPETAREKERKEPREKDRDRDKDRYRERERRKTWDWENGGGWDSNKWVNKQIFQLLYRMSATIRHFKDLPPSFLAKVNINSLRLCCCCCCMRCCFRSSIRVLMKSLALRFAEPANYSERLCIFIWACKKEVCCLLQYSAVYFLLPSIYILSIAS